MEERVQLPFGVNYLVKGSQIPIIIYSTTILPRHADDYQKLGAHDVVRKHTQFKDLCNALQVILEKLGVPFDSQYQ